MTGIIKTDQLQGAQSSTIAVPSGNNLTVGGTLGVTGAITGTLATAAQPNVTSVGTLTSFRSTGIDDNADATAITIDSSKRVGIGLSSPAAPFHVQTSTDGTGLSGDDVYVARFQNQEATSDKSFGVDIQAGSSTTDQALRIKDHDGTNTLIIVDGVGNATVGVTSKNSSNNGSLTIGHTGMTKITAGANGNADELVLIGANASANVGMSIIANNANISGVFFGDEDDTDIGRIEYYHSDNSMRFQTNTAERMRIESTGRIAIGRSSSYQSAKVTIENNAHGNYLYMGGSTENNRGLLFTSSVGSTGAAYLGAKHTILAQSGGGEIQVKNDTYNWFFLGPTGHVYVCATSFASASKGKQFENNNNCISLRSGSAVTTTSYHEEFHNANGMVGSVTTNASSTNFNTSSDYRLKENVSCDFDATSRLKQLKPSRFNFKADADVTLDGFLAHEVSSTVPEAVTGEKDAVDSDGNIVAQSIDQSKLVPLLTKSLQEALLRIEILEAEVKALKG